jgi:hypothetical protein
MAIPGYAAVASLYKTTRLYRGCSGVAGVEAGPNVVAQQIDCETGCALRWQLCNIGCAISTGPLVPLCLAACGASLAICLNGCPPSGGSPPPPPPPGECPRGRRCCERDPDGRCTLCVPEGAQCP